MRRTIFDSFAEIFCRRTAHKFLHSGHSKPRTTRKSFAISTKKENDTMSSNSKSSGSSKIMVPEAREAMDKFKMEAADEVGVELKQGYNGSLTSREAGSIGGQMVKKMIKAYEDSME